MLDGSLVVDFSLCARSLPFCPVPCDFGATCYEQFQLNRIKYTRVKYIRTWSPGDHWLGGSFESIAARNHRENPVERIYFRAARPRILTILTACDNNCDFIGVPRSSWKEVIRLNRERGNVETNRSREFEKCNDVEPHVVHERHLVGWISNFARYTGVPRSRFVRLNNPNAVFPSEKSWLLVVIPLVAVKHTAGGIL